jgi:hypothetical protein
MAKQKRDPEKPEHYADMWSCEYCFSLWDGKDPPPACFCGCEFFENVCDMLRSTTTRH